MMHAEINLKKQLFTLCLAFMEERIANAKAAMRMAQASANEETKSSAGDKYETGRAMAQLEIENNSAQLSEAMKQQQVLNQLQLETDTMKVRPGSLVFTNEGNYFLAIPAGKMEIDGISYYAVSPASPIGVRLTGLKTGASISFNKKEIVIEKIM